MGHRDIEVVRSARDGLLAEHCAVQHLEHIQACPGRGAVGAEAEADAAAHHLHNARDADAVIIQRTVAGRNIALGVEIHLVRAEQNRVRRMNVVVQALRLLEIFGGPHTPTSDGVIHLIGALGQMGVNGRSERVGKLAHALRAERRC